MQMKGDTPLCKYRGTHPLLKLLRQTAAAGGPAARREGQGRGAGRPPSARGRGRHEIGPGWGIGLAERAAGPRRGPAGGRQDPAARGPGVPESRDGAAGQTREPGTCWWSGRFKPGKGFSVKGLGAAGRPFGKIEVGSLPSVHHNKIQMGLTFKSKKQRY